MRSTLAFMTIALSASVAVPAFAAPPAAPAATTAPTMCVSGISKEARKALFDLQTSVVAKDANYDVKLAAAQKAAKSADDKCFIGMMQQKAAADRKDLNGVKAAFEAQLASGAVPATIMADNFESLGKLQYQENSFDAASASFERALQLSPNDASATIMLGETRVKQSRVGEAIPLYKKAIATELAAGRKPSEDWYKRAVAVAYNAKSAVAPSLARDWATAYPTSKNWREAIRIYSGSSNLDEASLIDLYRLARLNKALIGDSDYGRYASVALSRGYAGEAKGVLEEGYAANAIDRSQATLKSIYTSASAKSVGDRAGLDAQAKIALAGAASKPAMSIGEAYFGYGDYAKAADMFRAAKDKTGADTGLASLRLGMALAASGDKAGAKAALSAVPNGPRGEIARYWLAYLVSRP